MHSPDTVISVLLSVMGHLFHPRVREQNANGVKLNKSRCELDSEKNIFSYMHSVSRFVCTFHLVCASKKCKG